MKNKRIDIQQIVNPAKFQKIQDDISTATGLAIITVDYRGVPITSHSNCSDFCKVMRSSEKYRDYCEKCDSRGGLEAARLQSPFIYYCHAGLIDLAIPIVVDNLYLGAFMAGQILLDKNDNINSLERILPGAYDPMDLSDNSTLSKYYSMLHVMSLERVEALAKMLQHIGNYCVEQAILKTSIDELTKKMCVDDSSKTYQQDIELNKLSVPHERTVNRILQPAIEYIQQHLDEKITLSKMASLCKVSDSYFSKLFAKEGLGSLSVYVNNVKMARAKELLKSNDWPIRYIAHNLAYDDSSYFIKVFKKNTGMTPEEYRNHFSSNRA
jgi:ligand-binding sensor protein/AraC-like DNA-binding protein